MASRPLKINGQCCGEVKITRPAHARDLSNSWYQKYLLEEQALKSIVLEGPALMAETQKATKGGKRAMDCYPRLLDLFENAARTKGERLNVEVSTAG